jgi:cellulose biosynthesis protein BcsQ
MKRVTFFNKKGGTGKTSLSFNIAKDLGFPLLSNDDSVIEDIYPNKARILPEIQVIEHDCIYDLGGYIDVGIIDIFKSSSTVVVPTTLDINSVKRTINTVMEVNKYCENIIVVLNRVKKDKMQKYKQSIEALKGLGKKIILIRESEAITNSIHLGKTISELYNESNFSKNQYKGIYSDYQELLNDIKG